MKKLTIILLILLISKITMADSFNISNLGLTYHGTYTDTKSVTDVMKRKVTNNGRVAQHIELNLTYTKADDTFINTTILRDCFDNTAYHLGYGKQWALNDDKTLYSSLSLGLYVRPTVKEVAMDWGNRSNGYDTMIVPWLGLKKNVKLTEDVSLSLQVNTNYVLTHGTIGFEFNF